MQCVVCHGNNWINWKIEGIELLRAIENDLSIGTFVAKGSSFGVNVKQDLLRAIDEMSRNKIRKLY